MKEQRAVCGCCFASPGCGVVVQFDEQGRIDTLRPDPSAPLPATCRISDAAKQIVYAENRVLYPQKRVGPKGTYDFERISWDEAFDTIAQRLLRIKERHGPEATAIYIGRASFERSFCDIFQPRDVAVSSAASVLFPFGSPNTMGAGAYCYVSFAMIAPHVTMGAMHIDMFSDLDHSDLIVVWGTNPKTASPPTAFDRIALAAREGAKVIVIDPRKTGAALLENAEWVPIRPGTDGALALSMCHVIISEHLYDAEFVEHWTLGFDDLARYVQEFEPETAAHITGIPPATIRRLAREIATAEGAAPIMYAGLEYTPSGLQNIRATMVLWAIAGQLDVAGGRCFAMRENLFPINRGGHIPNPCPQKALGHDLFPLYNHYRKEAHAITLPRSVLESQPYPVRALIVQGASIMTAWPNPSLWRKTLLNLDHLVCIDRQLTADAAYADIVLPAATGFEIESYCYYGSAFRIRERVIDPLGEAKSDYAILAGLAERLGYGHLYPQTSEAVLAHALKGSPYTPEEVRRAGGIVRMPVAPMEYRKWEKGLLRKDGKPGFETPTGKFEIASTILEKHGYDALPRYKEPEEGPRSQPELARRFPLVFNSGALVKSDFHTSFRAIAGLIEERPVPTVTMNSEDALERGIASGDWVVVKTLRGQVEVAAVVTDQILKGCVDVSTGGGGPLGTVEWQKCNVNLLTDMEQYDPISGFPVYKALLCQVVKKKRKSRRVIAAVDPTLGCGQ
jgi:anaerobic selenocysteine-containing dehydrogenase